MLPSYYELWYTDSKNNMIIRRCRVAFMFQCIILNLFLANFVRGIRRKASFISHLNFLRGFLSKNQLDLLKKALSNKTKTFLGIPSLFFGPFLVQKRSIYSWFSKIKRNIKYRFLEKEIGQKYGETTYVQQTTDAKNAI